MLLFRDYISTHPGWEQSQAVSCMLALDEGEGMWGLGPARIQSWMEGVQTLLAFGGVIPYVAGRVTETKDNSGTIAYAAGGLEFKAQAAPSDTDDVAITGIETATIAQDKWLAGLMSINLADADKYGFAFGLVTSGSTEVMSANAADMIVIRKAEDVATPVVGRVVENSSAADDQNVNQTISGTDLTMTDNGRCILGFLCKAGSSAANSAGAFYCWRSGDPYGGIATPFDANQLDALRKILATTPATLAGHLGFRLEGTAQKSGVVNWAYAFMER